MWFGYCLVFVGGFLMVLMSIYCSVEREIGGNFDVDVIVCVLCWGRFCLGHNCLCIMHSLNQYMKHDFVLAVNVQEELVILLLLLV